MKLCAKVWLAYGVVLVCSACASGESTRPRGMASWDGSTPDAVSVEDGEIAICPGDCTPGETQERTLDCGACDEGRRVDVRMCDPDCQFGAWLTGECVSDAACEPGDIEVENRECPGSCGMTQRRVRRCDSLSCRWQAFETWSECDPCGDICGDSICDETETCETCSDCQNGHLGAGEDGDSCAGVPSESWRCVSSERWGVQVSQFCRDGTWRNFHLSPRECGACVCSYSSACRQTGA